MTDTRPGPLVPADCDLRDYPFTPIFRARLFGSSFHARATDSEWRAGVTLWLKSWDQVPAGTLPNDDVDLCRLAELGRDLKTWKKVKDRALHGWVECRDGRLHHQVVADGVIEASSKRHAASTKGKAGAKARWKTGNGAGIGTGNATVIENDASGIAQAMPGDGKLSKVKLSEEEPVLIAKAISGVAAIQGMVAGKPEWWPKRDRYGRVLGDVSEKVMFDVGKAVLGKSCGGQIAKLRKCYHHDLRAVTDLLLQADEKSNPSEWFAKVVRSAEIDEKPVPQHEKFPEEIYRDR